MALVLRKAFMQKNASILKCFKGRPFATAPNRKHTASLLAARGAALGPHDARQTLCCGDHLTHWTSVRWYAEKKSENKEVKPAARRIYKLKTPSVLTKPRRTKLPRPTLRSSAGKGTIRRIQFTISCPQVGTLVAPKTALSFRQFSSIAGLKRFNSLQDISRQVSKRHASCNAGCPCPFPCGPCGCKGGCGCLPPPCNTPPKCLQYMTGYYYYPYGTWFCGPYHVSGTCSPVGSGCPCPCPCPVKCCPACICAPAQNMATGKNISDINQFPVEIPLPKVPQEARGGMSKIFNFNGPADKKSQQKQKPTSIPPVMSTLLCHNLSQPSHLMDKEPRIQSSYPIDGPKQRFYHTNNSTSARDVKAPEVKKNLKYCYYQTRNKATPMARARMFLKENKNSLRSKLDSDPNQKRRDPRPEVDIEIKPYEDGRMN